MIDLKLSDSLSNFDFLMMEKIIISVERERERERTNYVFIKLYVFFRIIIQALYLRHIDTLPP